MDEPNPDPVSNTTILQELRKLQSQQQQFQQFMQLRLQQAERRLDTRLDLIEARCNNLESRIDSMFVALSYHPLICTGF